MRRLERALRGSPALGGGESSAHWRSYRMSDASAESTAPVRARAHACAWVEGGGANARTVATSIRMVASCSCRCHTSLRRARTARAAPVSAVSASASRTSCTSCASDRCVHLASALAPSPNGGCRAAIRTLSSAAVACRSPLSAPSSDGDGFSRPAPNRRPAVRNGRGHFALPAGVSDVPARLRCGGRARAVERAQRHRTRRARQRVRRRAPRAHRARRARRPRIWRRAARARVARARWRRRFRRLVALWRRGVLWIRSRCPLRLCVRIARPARRAAELGVGRGADVGGPPAGDERRAAHLPRRAGARTAQRAHRRLAAHARRASPCSTPRDDARGSGRAHPRSRGVRSPTTPSRPWRSSPPSFEALPPPGATARCSCTTRQPFCSALSVGVRTLCAWAFSSACCTT